jgi:hypothetical protein
MSTGFSFLSPSQKETTQQENLTAYYTTKNPERKRPGFFYV